MGSKVDFADLVTTPNSKSIVIHYDQIFNQPDIEHMDNYELGKRSYYSINELIKDSLVRLFNECQDKAVLPYLMVSKKIKDLNKDYDFDDFKKDLEECIFNDSVKDSVTAYVNATYSDIMDENENSEKPAKNINKELQFTDEHVRILLKTSESIRIAIPITILFCNERNVDMNSTLYNSFVEIIKIYQGKIKMMNKLHRFIYSRVVNTQYSDKSIWNLLTSKSKDVHVVTMEFMRDIINGILPKTVNDRNIINLFHVVIKRKLSFEFSKDYNVTFKPVNLNQIDSEGLTPFDKWEVSMIKKNENKITINKLSIKQQIKNTENFFGIKIDDDEFNYYKERIKFNSFQINMLFYFFAKYIGSYNNSYNSDYDEYVYLLITLYHWLNQNGFNVLADYLIAIPDKLNEKRMTNNKSKIYSRVTESKTYKDLLANKYKFIATNITENNTITRIIGSISISKFVPLNPYENFINNVDFGEVEELNDIYSVDVISNEIINFIKII